MCNQVLSNKSVVSEASSESLSIVRLIRRWLGYFSSEKRKVLRTSELSPDILRDIGLEDTRRRSGSLDENWRRELDQLSKW